MNDKDSTLADEYIQYSQSDTSDTEKGNGFTLPKIKDLEECDRPFERAEAHGVEVLANADLLALILRSGTPGTPITELCRNIMRHHTGKFQSLSRSPMEELMKFPGVGKVKAMQIRAVMEIVSRFNSESVEDSPRINSSESLAKLMTPKIGNAAIEYIYLICLSQSLRLIKIVELSKGTPTASVFDVKQALRHALICDAQAIMLCHNHPSGNMKPSIQDDRLTESLKEACKVMNLLFLDHVIVGSGSNEHPLFYSYFDQGKL